VRSHEENRLESSPNSQESISTIDERVFTIDPRTGQLVKIQKVDRASGQLGELSNSEYISLWAGFFSLVWFGQLVAGVATLRAAYDCGVEDCRTWWQLASNGYWSSEEVAYYQGVNDCSEALAQMTAGWPCLGDRLVYPMLSRLAPFRLEHGVKNQELLKLG